MSIRIRIPEAMLTDDNGKVVGYVTGVNDAYGSQFFCYDAEGKCLKSFTVTELKELGIRSSFDIAQLFAKEMEHTQ